MTNLDLNSSTHAGLPKSSSYKKLISSPEFKKISDYSYSFIEKHPELYSSYSKKWVTNPLHQWSRQWEYPFVLDQISEAVSGKKESRILDAGSGLTFFPYFLMDSFDGLKVSCCDYDKKLINAYVEVNKKQKQSVNFSIEDLRNMNYPDDSFDAIYCISVLEHTNDYPAILEEFHRILKKGGKLIITFDISLQGTRDISITESQKLINTIDRLFHNFPHDKNDISQLIEHEKDLLTTNIAAQIDHKLLPWKYPKIVYWLKHKAEGRPWKEWPPLLTIYCLCAEK